MKRKPYKYTKDVLTDAVKDVFSYRQLIKKFGRNQSGGLHYHLKKLIEFYGIDVSHFTGQAHNCGKKSKYKHTKESFISNVLIIGSRWASHQIKLRLYEFGIKRECCENCNTTTWHDNRIENLRILCPNCHSQTKTFAGKNNKGRSQG